MTVSKGMSLRLQPLAVQGLLRFEHLFLCGISPLHAWTQAISADIRDPGSLWLVLLVLYVHDAITHGASLTFSRPSSSPLILCLSELLSQNAIELHMPGIHRHMEQEDRPMRQTLCFVDVAQLAQEAAIDATVFLIPALSE